MVARGWSNIRHRHNIENLKPSIIAKLTDFRDIPTSAARYQNLSLNPTKLSGQCGRLKCCLNYELETYMDALSDVPQVEKTLKTVKGDASLQKTDIFRKIMWFSYHNDSNWVSIPMAKVVELQKMNEQNLIPNALDDLQMPDNQAIEKPTAINSDLTRLDKKYSNNKNKFKNQSGERQNFNRPNENKPRPMNENRGENLPNSGENPQNVNRPSNPNNRPNRQNNNPNRPNNNNRNNNPNNKS